LINTMKSNKNKSNKPIQEWSKPKGGLRENDPPSVWEPSYRNTKKLQLSENDRLLAKGNKQ